MFKASGIITIYDGTRYERRKNISNEVKSLQEIVAWVCGYHAIKIFSNILNLTDDAAFN